MLRRACINGATSLTVAPLFLHAWCASSLEMFAPCAARPVSVTILRSLCVVLCQGRGHFTVHSTLVQSLLRNNPTRVAHTHTQPRNVARLPNRMQCVVSMRCRWRVDVTHGSLPRVLLTDPVRADMSAASASSETAPLRERLFEGLKDAVSDENAVTVIESLCVNCEDTVRCRRAHSVLSCPRGRPRVSRSERAQGTTRLLLTQIPHFREIVLISFECPHCGYRNNEVQPAGIIQVSHCCCDVVNALLLRIALTWRGGTDRFRARGSALLCASRRRPT
jgi:hypothetical protein